ncbi:GNAT family N-acetyltransferase [Azospirillum griseum]|uniref:GNAT family N-acetyltransferase n=1 Tax=Azospirillum griseum TaxID=2496639 RepID=A0A431VMX0_9PROT|nr:GNAT family N-acetyltransferase [Azospirillum griseum]RTR23731.1 GNAT family N-acetyltransferase [Azospirillum griseum]
MTNDQLTLSVAEAIDAQEADRVFVGLKAHNEMASGRAYTRRDLAVMLRDAAGVLRAGLVGYTNWDWLYVDHLWVDDGLRRGGVGRRLLDAAEEEARARGCRWSRLYTYDFQAPGFYPKCGYTEWCRMDGYPEGHAQIWFRKPLV